MNERLMMSEEECRKKVKELLQIPKEDLLIKYMFQEQEIERLNNIIKSLFDYCKEQQEKSFDSVAEECYAEVMYFISERLEKIKELRESGNND